ncbi:hypothetical protein JMUB5695_04399 [Mycobacterium heckeshornense]|nr:hypothetical protein JMUB5695_04399 [Mycobacterium heckeshornense]
MLNTEIGSERYHSRMPDTPASQVPPGQNPPRLPPPPMSPAPWIPQPPAAWPKPLRWPSFAALLIALIGVAIGIVGWFRPVPRNEQPASPTVPTYTDRQITDARSNICNAYKLAKNEVFENTHRPTPGEADLIGSLAVAANGRLAVHAAADYLMNHLAAQPATPADFAHAVHSLADTYQEFAMRALNNEPNSALDGLRHNIDSYIAKIDGLCK